MSNQIVKGIVMAVSQDGLSAKVSIVLSSEVANGEPRFVIIRADHHCAPRLCRGQKYGVDLGERSSSRLIAEKDYILLRRHSHNPGVAWQWCFEDDKVAALVKTEVMTVAPEVKKLTYGEKARLRRIQEFKERKASTEEPSSEEQVA